MHAPNHLEHRGQELLVLQQLHKSYNVGQPTEVEVLHGLDLQLMHGEFAALIGPSGSGKSTLLNILGLLERGTRGHYRLAGHTVEDLDDEGLTGLRRDTLGFVFQFHHLLPAFTALENVLMPALAREGRIQPAVRQRAIELLSAVGLGHAVARKPAELSGGMQQRVAMARALMLSPRLVLADEPTGNLDTASSAEVFALMRRIHEDFGTTFLIVTHDSRLANRCDRIIELVDGRVARDAAPQRVSGETPGCSPCS
ncbi:MAG TPA: ABC transporter ATP-binding protein [Aquabacterium sp.]|nr:ABC transporter ATP-binding protein [Aquabacterium sp.]